ncbi:hypothetical protein [Fodinibius sp. Rm-B-1B1-1]|uniref:hypothetical protein n=1 Tax=Fodinibius alkaliphilus TaxID=3140241 RepID=UPI00315AD4DB
MKYLENMFKSFSQKIISRTSALILFLFILITVDAKAQNKVTFQVNLEPQLKDSIFVPKRDKIYVKGNIFPLTNSRKVYLEDKAPTDSVFEATVNFPSSAIGQTLQFNYIIATPSKKITEQMSRQIQLQSGDRELDALYFNSFAW